MISEFCLRRTLSPSVSAPIRDRAAECNAQPEGMDGRVGSRSTSITSQMPVKAGNTRSARYLLIR